MKKVFSGAKETHPNILRGGHRTHTNWKMK